MNVNQETGLLSSTLFIASPNFNSRPANTLIDLLVIHGISVPPNEFGGNEIIALFTNTLDTTAHVSLQSLEGLRVSSHLLIRRDGELIQFVPFHSRAWHAGVSSWKGKENCNDYSIGIELEGTDTLPYEDVQYTQCRQVIQALQQAYPAITDARIVGHADVAPGRKTDPGSAFCWEKIR